MKWRKLGLLLKPDVGIPWLATHAAAPYTCATTDSGVFDVYVSGRDTQNRSRIGLVRLDMTKRKIIDISSEPLLALGDRGTFDQNGTSYPHVVVDGDRKFLYYTGWIPGVLVPFMNDLGLAISENDGPFVRYSRAPLLPRTDADFLGIGSVYVLRENELWRMWYTSFVEWPAEVNQPKHYYLIKYAESRDGLNWERRNHIAINFKNTAEYVTAKPCVRKLNGRYCMWLSCRGGSYRIGLAESRDGVNWQRKDEAVGIDVSATGWDSEMICYGHVFDYAGQHYMLYNGNGYGASGMGLAVLENAHT